MLRFLTLPLLFVALSLSAQVEYGTITYLQTSEMEWKTENEVETPQGTPVTFIRTPRQIPSSTPT